MADGTGANSLLNSVASIASRSRDVETPVKVKPNTTPPGNITGTLTLLDTPIQLASYSNTNAFSWTDINVYQVLPSDAKGVYIFIQGSYNTGLTNLALVEVRRDNMGTTPTYEALRIYAGFSSARLFVPVSQHGTFQIQATDSVAKTYDIIVTAEAYLR